MKKKRVSVKVYMTEDSEVFREVQRLSELTSLSASTVAGMALRYGLPSVSATLGNMLESDTYKKPKPKPKSKRK